MKIVYHNNRAMVALVDLILTTICVIPNSVCGESISFGEREGPPSTDLVLEHQNQRTKAEPSGGQLDSQNGGRTDVTRLLEKAIAARGGRDVLERFRVSKAVITSTGTVRGKRFAIRVTQYLQLPSKLRLDQERLSDVGNSLSHETFYILGNETLTMAKPALGFIPKKIDWESEQRIRQGLYLEECKSLIPLLDSSYDVEKVVPERVALENGTIALRVRKLGKGDVTLLIEQNTGNLVGIDSDQLVKGGRIVQTRTRFSDFRTFSGLTSPAAVRYVEGADVESTAKIESIEQLDAFPEPGLNAQEVALLKQSAPRTFQTVQHNDTVSRASGYNVHSCSWL